MKNPDVFITPEEFAAAYTRAFQWDLAEVKLPKQLKAKNPRKK